MRNRKLLCQITINRSISHVISWSWRQFNNQLHTHKPRVNSYSVKINSNAIAMKKINIYIEFWITISTKFNAVIIKLGKILSYFAQKPKTIMKFIIVRLNRKNECSDHSNSFPEKKIP